MTIYGQAQGIRKCPAPADKVEKCRKIGVFAKKHLTESRLMINIIFVIENR